MTTHTLPHSPIPQPAKKLRPCLSPTRMSRSTSPVELEVGLGRSYPAPPTPPTRSTSVDSTSSSVFSEGLNGQWFKRTKSVRWEGGFEGSAVTSCHEVDSSENYDRTPLAPPAPSERDCVLPERGSRCLSTLWKCHSADVDEDEEEVLEGFVDSPEGSDFGADEETNLSTNETESDTEHATAEEDDDCWSECLERRRMMFERMCPQDRDGPQFEGYRSLSATLVELLRSVGCDDDGQSTPRGRCAPIHEDEDDEEVATDVEVEPPSSALLLPTFSHPTAFARYRSFSADSDDVDAVTEIGTPSLVSSAGSDGTSSLMASPRGSAIDFVLTPASASPSKGAATGNMSGVSHSLIQLELLAEVDSADETDAVAQSLIHSSTNDQ